MVGPAAIQKKVRTILFREGWEFVKPESLRLLLFHSKPNLPNVLPRSAVKKNSKFHCERTDDQISIRKNISGSNKLFEDLVVKNNIDTVHKIWKNSVKLYGEKNCLGTRF